MALKNWADIWGDIWGDIWAVESVAATGRLYTDRTLHIGFSPRNKQPHFRLSRSRVPATSGIDFVEGGGIDFVEGGAITPVEEE